MKITRPQRQESGKWASPWPTDLPSDIDANNVPSLKFIALRDLKLELAQNEEKKNMYTILKPD